MVDIVRDAFKASIELDDFVLKRRHMSKSQGLYGRTVSYKNNENGNAVSIRQAGYENSDSWDVSVYYVSENSEDLVKIRGLINIFKDEKALEILLDIINNFYLKKEGEISATEDTSAQENGFRNDIAGFVESPKACENDVKMFDDKIKKVDSSFCFMNDGKSAYLNCKSNFSNEPQVKVSACQKRRDKLEKVLEPVKKNNGIVSPELIEEALYSRSIDEEKDL